MTNSQEQVPLTFGFNSGFCPLLAWKACIVPYVGKSLKIVLTTCKRRNFYGRVGGGGAGENEFWCRACSE